jgi:hypothetical protein
VMLLNSFARMDSVNGRHGGLGALSRLGLRLDWGLIFRRLHSLLVPVLAMKIIVLAGILNERDDTQQMRN